LTAIAATTAPLALAWALRYARLGWPVLPFWWCREDGSCACSKPSARCKRDRPGKHPLSDLVPNGFKNATIDPAVIRAWFDRFPKANPAARTGPESGLLVLDIDGPEGEASLVALERQHGPLPELYPMQWTGGGRGGWQSFFAYPEGRRIASRAGWLGPGIDVRAQDGCAILPPSRTIEHYRWVLDRSPFDLPLEPAPDWLVELLDPPQTAREPWQAPRSPAEDRYLLRALEAELALVASAPEGRRNDQLNESAFNLFRFAVEGRLDAGAIAHGLHAAASHAGLGEREIAATLRSAAIKRGISL
jgi:hypothetical protein